MRLMHFWKMDDNQIATIEAKKKTIFLKAVGYRTLSKRFIQCISICLLLDASKIDPLTLLGHFLRHP